MTDRAQFLQLTIFLLAGSLLLAGCDRSARAPIADAALPAAVQIRARVSGTIDRVGFAAGAAVRKGQILFRIDPLPFRAESERRFIARTQALNALEAAEANRARVGRAGGAESRAALARLDADIDASRHALTAATAALNASKKDLELTEIRAPIDGLASRALLKQGDLVASNSLLTTVTDQRLAANGAVSADPAYGRATASLAP